MSQKKIRFIFGFVIVIFLLMLFLSGCKPAELKTLESSSSIIQLQTGLEVRRSLQDKDTVLGKPIYAEMYIEYEPIDNYTKKEVYDEIIAILKKNNWEEDEKGFLFEPVVWGWPEKELYPKRQNDIVARG
jgi:hypothetical protein